MRPRRRARRRGFQGRCRRPSRPPSASCRRWTALHACLVVSALLLKRILPDATAMVRPGLLCPAIFGMKICVELMLSHHARRQLSACLHGSRSRCVFSTARVSAGSETPWYSSPASKASTSGRTSPAIKSSHLSQVHLRSVSHFFSAMPPLLYTPN